MVLKFIDIKTVNFKTTSTMKSTDVCLVLIRENTRILVVIMNPNESLSKTNRKVQKGNCHTSLQSLLHSTVDHTPVWTLWKHIKESKDKSNTLYGLQDIQTRLTLKYHVPFTHHFWWRKRIKTIRLQTLFVQI